MCRDEIRKKKKEMEGKKRKGKKKKIVKYRMKTCRRVLISTPQYQVGAGTFVT
jgi:hypothetical protein